MSEHARRLRGEREAIASGHLTLDRDKARAKLQEFRLPDPHFYVLQFVRAASMMGATRIEFAVGPSTTICAFDAELEHGALGDIWSVAFDERRTRGQAAIHNLALGLASAQALNPEFVEVVSGSSKLTIREDSEELDSCAPGARTKITVKEKFRFGHITEFFESFVDDLPEGRALRRACQYSLMEVVYNGVTVNTLWGRPGPAHEEETDDGHIKVQGQRSFDGVKYVLLRDDVLVSVVRMRALFLPGRSVQNSRTAPMDLTGLVLRDKLPWFPRDARSAYHRLLRSWLPRNPLSPAARQTGLQALCEELAVTSADEVGEGTRELLASLLTDPMFSPAVADGPRVPLRSADDDVIEYSTRCFAMPTAQEAIAFIPEDSPLPEQLARVGYPVRDVTVPLSQRARKARNKARFEAQPARPPRDRSHEDNAITVRLGELIGYVEATKGFQVGAGRVRLDGRVLLEREGPIPYDVEISGPVQPNEYFDNVDRDETFDELALLMLRAARRLFAEHVTDRGRVTLLLNRLVREEFESDFLGLLGYGKKEAQKLLSRREIVRDRDRRWLLSEAGPLADVKVFSSLFDDAYSLRDIMESPRPPLLCSRWTPRAQAASHDRPVIYPTPSQEHLVRLVAPRTHDLVAGLRREAVESSFMQRAVFRPRRMPAALFSLRVRGTGYVLELELLGGSPRDGTAEVYIVWRGRLLARHRWSAPRGTWRVVVRSDALTPVDTYDDVEEDELFKQITAAFAGAVDTALAGWRRSVGENRELDVRGWELFVATTLRHDDVDEIRLPAWRLVNGSWETVLAPLELLAESARRTGRLRYTRPGTPPGAATQDQELLVQLPAPVDPRQVTLGPLAGVRMVYAEDRLNDPIESYIRRSSKPSPPVDTLLHHDDVVDGFTVSTWLTEQRGAPRHVVELIWQGRVLERIEGPDVASFRSLVRGSNLGPNEELTLARAGRSEALAAAAANARNTIVKACDQVRAPGADALRTELLRIATNSERCEDESWWQFLQSAPLLEAPGGYESFVDRARRRASPTSGDALDEVAQVLRVARGDRGDLVHEFTLAGLRWAEDDQDALCVVGAEVVSVRRDHELVRAAREGDPVVTHFLASCVFTQINAYYREISDADEVELQARLLRTNL